MSDIRLMYGANVKVAQLHYVRAVADLGSLSQAAAALGLTQPALSNGLAALEAVLGGRIFDRTTRGASLTEFGGVLLPHVDRVLTAVNALREQASAMSGRGEAALRVGVSPLIHPRLVARAFEAARHGLAGGLVLREQNLARLQAALQRNELDVVLVPAVDTGEGLRRRAIDSDPLWYIGTEGAQDGDAAPGGEIELAEVMRQVQVLVADECGLTRFVRRLFDERGAPLERYPGEPHSYRNLVEWARLGLGGAVLPASRFDAATGPGRALTENGVAVVIGYEAQWLAASPRAEAIESLLDSMLDSAADAGTVAHT
jgi:DNA-binding transcriptional LysR family regulator